MADKTPLISHGGDNHDSPPPETAEKPPLNLDSAIEECIGEFGWAQLTQSTLVSLSWFFDAQQTFISVFTDSPPPWHCTDSTCSAGAGSDVCKLPDSSWAWDGSRHVSVVSDWSLQCAQWRRGLPASSFFAGCLAGGILLATLADTTLGRRKMLLLSSLAMSASAFCTAFTDSVWAYALLRFICGFGRATIGTCALVLSTELVGRRWRGTVGMVGFFGFSLGFLSLPAMAFVNRGLSWRNLYLWTSVPGFIYCLLIYFFVHESPRWLFVRGRKEEALKTLRSIAPPDRQSHLTAAIFSADESHPAAATVDLFSALKLLVHRRWALHRLLCVTAAGFGIGVVYYGMPLSIGNLSFNLYAGVALNALSELPSTFLAMFLLAKFDRRTSLLFLTTASGLSSVAVCFVAPPYQKVQMALELVSFAGGCAALCTLLVYSLELFPTCVRNSAVAMVRQALVFGGVFGPMLVAAGKESGGALTFGVFGALIGCFGIFAACLPETRGEALSDTMEEEEGKVIMAAISAGGIDV